MIAALSLLAPFLASSGSPSPGTPPNILVLVADDLGVDSVAVYAEGADLPSTPRIDALASGGLLFRNAWSQPVCTPTRSAMMTGRHAFRTGMGWLAVNDVPGSALPLAEFIVPEVLDLAGSGYAHAAIGKWHMGNGEVGGPLAPNLAGFSHFAGSETNLSDYYNWTKVVDGVQSVSSNYATTETVDDALAWINAQTTPWYCYVAFHAPHTPFHAPPSNLHSVDLTTPSDRLYFKAMVEALDTEIGRLLDTLPSAVLDDTMVIFVGDNGTKQSITVAPFDRTHGKGTLYEGGVNVPLIVSGPQVSQPGEVRGLVTTADLFDTVLNLAGLGPGEVPPGAGEDSTSITPYFANPALPSLRSSVYAEMFRPNGPNLRPPNYVLWPTLPASICQDDVGFGGPGLSSLTVCGPPLFQGYLDSDQDATLLLSNAPVSSPGFLFLGYDLLPEPFGGGFIAPGANAQVLPFTTTAAGSLSIPIPPDPSVLGPAYYQTAVVDVSAVDGYDISNAVAVNTGPPDQEAIRSLTHKLILDNQTGDEAFFDLEADPFEQVNLLGGVLTQDQTEAYLALRQELFDLRPAPQLLRGGG